MKRTENHPKTMIIFQLRPDDTHFVTRPLPNVSVIRLCRCPNRNEFNSTYKLETITREQFLETHNQLMGCAARNHHFRPKGNKIRIQTTHCSIVRTYDYIWVLCHSQSDDKRTEFSVVLVLRNSKYFRFGFIRINNVCRVCACVHCCLYEQWWVEWIEYARSSVAFQFWFFRLIVSQSQWTN